MKITIPIPLQEELHRLFEYREGNLYRKIQVSSNARIGANAGQNSGNGYRQVTVNCIKYYMHRIIWIYHYGAIPNKLEIDHIDGNRTNNIIENLRLATSAQNKMNHKRALPSSRSNILGVRWCKARNKWKAAIQNNRKSIHLGSFANQEDAIAARKAAELQYFGEFAP